MAALVAVVAARVVGRQAAVTSNVTASIATVAPVQILLAVACKVTHLVALIALLPTSEVPAVARSTDSAATTTTADVLAVTGVVAGAVTLEASIRGHHLADSCSVGC